MTTQRSFKRLVRTRMEKTGESYTAARAVLLAAEEPAGPTARARDVRRGDPGADRARLGAVVRPARRVGRRRAVAPGRRAAGRRRARDPPAGVERAGDHGSYERARGLREVGEHEDGFTVTASKTVAVPVERLYAAFVDEEQRARWLPDGPLRERTHIEPRSARFDWGDGATRSTSRSWRRARARAVALSHERLADSGEAERTKAFWRERVSTLKAVLEA